MITRISTDRPARMTLPSEEVCCGNEIIWSAVHCCRQAQLPHQHWRPEEILALTSRVSEPWRTLYVAIYTRTYLLIFDCIIMRLTGRVWEENTRERRIICPPHAHFNEPHPPISPLHFTNTCANNEHPAQHWKEGSPSPVVPDRIYAAAVVSSSYHKYLVNNLWLHKTTNTKPICLL